jgi:hypothetical protein
MVWMRLFRFTLGVISVGGSPQSLANPKSAILSTPSPLRSKFET